MPGSIAECQPVPRARSNRRGRCAFLAVGRSSETAGQTAISRRGEPGRQRIQCPLDVYPPQGLFRVAPQWGPWPFTFAGSPLRCVVAGGSQTLHVGVEIADRMRRSLPIFTDTGAPLRMRS